MYRAKLLGRIEADGVNGILRFTTITVPLKYLSNFWRSLKMPLFLCKVELKVRWTNQFVLSASGADNDDDNRNNIIFTMEDKKLYAPVFTLLAKDNQKLSDLLS